MSAATSDYDFAPEERPALPGSPFSPRHSAGRRVAYAGTALLCGLSATFCNGLFTTNAPALAGALGLTIVQASLLPAVYVAFNAAANLLLVKARIQFGIPIVTLSLLFVYMVAALWQIFVPNYGSAILVRAAAGLAGAALTTMTIYNLFQVFPAKARPAALVIGIGLTQLGPAFSRLVPIEALTIGGDLGVHLIEFGAVAITLVANLLLPLPPSENSPAFEPLDFVTVGLLFPAIALVCAVLGEGRLLWWADTPWLGWALAAAAPLFVAGVMVESGRQRPLLHIGWIGSIDIVRFAAVALLMRFALAEQTYGAVGLLASGGLTSDQLHLLFGFVICAMILGTAASVLTLTVDRLAHQVLVAALFIAAGAWMDSHANNLTRPEQLYLSQSLIAFGATLFVGPALLIGFLRMMQAGPAFFVSFIVLFSLTQNIGGLGGAAALGSLQVVSARAHAASLSEHLLAADPQVAARLQGGAGALAGAITDPAARGAQGGGLLVQAMTREANVLAFNDVFRLVMVLALLTALYVGYLIIFYRLQRRRQEAQA